MIIWLVGINQQLIQTYYRLEFQTMQIFKRQPLQIHLSFLQNLTHFRYSWFGD